jgi:hypothetical protein
VAVTVGGQHEGSYPRYIPFLCALYVTCGLGHIFAFFYPSARKYHYPLETLTTAMKKSVVIVVPVFNESPPLTTISASL